MTKKIDKNRIYLSSRWLARLLFPFEQYIPASEWLAVGGKGVRNGILKISGNHIYKMGGTRIHLCFYHWDIGYLSITIQYVVCKSCIVHMDCRWSKNSRNDSLRYPREHSRSKKQSLIPPLTKEAPTLASGAFSFLFHYSTVTLFARFLGLSTSRPSEFAIWYAKSWRITTSRNGLSSDISGSNSITSA